tara:strand:- start:3979 stop:4806 length:828 start_codon:yes stop_codon:yes gene_type:complete
MDPINEIQTIGPIQGAYVRVDYIPSLYYRPWGIVEPNVDYLIPPVVLQIGSPIVDMPGCVEMHQDNKIHKTNIPKDKDLVNTDPKKTTVLCPSGQYPSYDAMNYEPEQLILTREAPPPPVAGTPDAPDTPETPATPDTNVEDPPCPGPTSLRIGAVGPSEKEKVVGHELQKTPQGTLICVELYEDIGVAEQYLPSGQVAATTAVIATVAGASALLAKPLADLLLRVFRPAIKQALTKANAALGKTPEKPSRSEVQANLYRQKKGLPPLQKSKKKK